jgi:exodeoxyribonuclease-1
MTQTFFFYDLETSGFNPRRDRIMQFAGQRTDMKLQPIGEPVNVLVKLSEEILPSPDAIMVTGITPQKTKEEGLTEADFMRLFEKEVAQPGTIFVGYNTVRFDDEFMRFIHYRNFYDAYEWQWKDDRTRWDLLDVIRMTRALRPDGINWPFDSEGKPANKLELLASVNKLDHTDAHDALSDVRATIALAQLVHQKQPKLFSYLRDMRDKKKVEKLVNAEEIFVYTSGKYPAEYEKTAVVGKVGPHPDQQGILVFDLRHDPTPYLAMSPEQLVEVWRYEKDSTKQRLPVKTLRYNRCPAVAPLSVLDKQSQERLKIDLDATKKHLDTLKTNKNFITNLNKAIKIMDKQRQESWLEDEATVDAKLYDGFFGGSDKTKMSVVRAADAEELRNFPAEFDDKRLQALLPLYKARNYPDSLSEEERSFWENFKQQQLAGGKKPALQTYFARLAELAKDSKLSKQKQFLLEELQLYGESLVATD